MISEKVVREKPIPDSKIEAVEYLVEKISNYRTVLIASCKGLPGQQFHEIKKKLRGKAEIKVAKKSVINRAIDQIEKGAVKNLKEQVGADVVILFSDLDPFELSGLLADNQSNRKARPGDVVPEDIEIEPGPTDLPPGPAISELGSVGLKVAVKEGKLEIMQGAVIIKKGEEVKENVASVLGKLDVAPIKVGFTPLAAYDTKEDKFYVDIKIDKKETLQALRDLVGKALGFAVGVGFPNKETIGFLLSKAAIEEKALGKLIKEGSEEKGNKEDNKVTSSEGVSDPENKGEDVKEGDSDKAGAEKKEEGEDKKVEEKKEDLNNENNEKKEGEE